nr:uncharacterized protein LOC122270009 [Parasteatoda tepidariorum]
MIQREAPGLIDNFNKIVTTTDLDEHTRALIKTVTAIATKIYRYRKIKPSTSPTWWTNKLKYERNRLNALNKRLQTSKDPIETKLNKEEYNKAKAKYRKQITKAKETSWKQFCNNHSDPYGEAYKLGHGKLFKPTDLNLKLPNNNIPNKQEALVYLSKFHFPDKDDTIADQPPLHTHHTNSEPHADTKEVRDALFAFLTSKAPGLDGLDFMIWRRVFEADPNILTNWGKSATNIHNQLVKLAPRTWGIQTKLLKLWYHTVAEKTLTYASAAWGTNLSKTAISERNKVQRPLLIRLARSFKKASNAALNVLTGIPPLHLFNTSNDQHSINAIDYQQKIKSNCTHPAEKISYKYISLPPSTPTDTITNIYTDGSKTEQGVGAAFCVYNNNHLTDTFKFTLKQDNTVFQAEILAIKEALNWLEAQNYREATIHTDSLAGMHALIKIKQRDPHVVETQKQLVHLASKCNIKIHWVAAHTGIIGNESADQAAKDATAGNGLQASIKLPPSSLKNKTKALIAKLWQEQWTESDKGQTTKTYYPMVSYDRLIGHPAVTQFLTGHGFFPTFLRRMHLVNTDECPCGELGSPEHYLYECPLTQPNHLRRPNPAHLTAFADSLSNISIIQKLTKIIETTKTITDNM